MSVPFSTSFFFTACSSLVFPFPNLFSAQQPPFTPFSASSLLPPYLVPYPSHRSLLYTKLFHCITCSSTALLLFCRSQFPFWYISPCYTAKKLFHCTLLSEFRSFWHFAWIHGSHRCHHFCRVNDLLSALYFISLKMLLQSITNSILSTSTGIYNP